MREIRIAPEVLDKPRGKPVRSQFGSEQHQLLRVRNGGIEEGKCVCQFGIGLVCGGCACVHIGGEKRLQAVKLLILGYFFKHERLPVGIQTLHLAGGDIERVLVGRAAVSLVCKRGTFFIRQGRDGFFAFSDGEQVGVKRIGQRIQTVRVTGTVRQPAQQQTEYAQLFVKRRVPQFGSANRLPGAGKQLIHAVNLPVFVIKL